MAENNERKPTLLQTILAWSVHLFTASGAFAGFLAILAIEERNWRTAMFWLLICLVIDGVDGTFAKLFKVREVLPYMDGKNIDYVIDFATYAIIPTYFFYATDLVEASWRLPLSFLILMTSAIYYGKDGMVEDDQYFVGFPVLWNLAFFYLFFVFQFSTWANALMIVLLSVLHFAPLKIAYPSHSRNFKNLNILVTIIAILGMFLTVWVYPERQIVLTVMMITCMLYFTLLAIWESYLLNQKHAK